LPNYAKLLFSKDKNHCLLYDLTAETGILRSYTSTVNKAPSQFRLVSHIL